MGPSVGRINLDLGINSSGFKKELSGIKKHAGGLESVFGKLGAAVAGAFAVQKIASFAKACIDLGSDLAEVQNVVDVTFGNMSKAVDKWAKDAMTSYGMSELVAKQYLGQYGAMSKAFGNTEQMAYDQATALTALAGDVASFYNLSTDEAFSKLKSVYTGETEALKSLGVVMSQTALDAFAMERGFGKTTKEMSEQEKVALRLAFVQDKLSGASGDFARTADGWANQTRVLSLRFDALKASIGQGLIAAFTPVLRILNDIMARLQVVADAFSEFMESIFGKSEDSTAGVTGAATSSGVLSSNMDNAASSAAAMKKSLAGFDKLNVLGGSSDSGSTSGDASTGVSSGIGSTASDAEEASGAAGKLTGVLTTLKTKLVEISQITGLSGLWNDFLIGTNNAKLGVENIFAALSEAILANAPNIAAFNESLVNTFLTLSQTITGIWGSVWTTLTENFLLWTEENQASVSTFFSNIIEAFTSVGTLISTAVGDLFADIKNWWESNGQPVFDGFIKCIGDVWAWILDIYNIVIAPIIAKIIEISTKLWEDTLRPMFQNVLGLISDVGEYIIVWWNKALKPVVDWIITHLGPPISNAFQHIVSVIGDAVGNIGDFINGIITSLRGIIQFITGVFSGDWKKAWNGVKTIFSGIWNSFKSIIAGPINGIMSGIESLVNGVISGLNFLIKAINGLSFDVPDWVPVIGGEKFGFNLKEINKVSLPRLASGGYVEANTPQLAIIGDNKREGEIVAPESKIAEAVARGFAMVLSKLQGQTGPQNDRPIYLTVKLGEDDFWSGFVDYHNSIVKRTGDSPLLV